MAQKRFFISFDQTRGPVSEDDVGRLRALCRDLDLSMRQMGVVVCEAPASAQAALKALPGVIGVEVEGVISIGPPDGKDPQ